MTYLLRGRPTNPVIKSQVLNYTCLFTRSTGTKATYRKTSASVNFKPDEEKKPASILPALCLAFGGQFFFGSLLKLLNDCLMFLSPQLLRFVAVYLSYLLFNNEITSGSNRNIFAVLQQNNQQCLCTYPRNIV